MKIIFCYLWTTIIQSNHVVEVVGNVNVQTTSKVIGFADPMIIQAPGKKIPKLQYQFLNI